MSARSRAGRCALKPVPRKKAAPDGVAFGGVVITTLIFIIWGRRKKQGAEKRELLKTKEK
jgi:hypothetical protein